MRILLTFSLLTIIIFTNSTAQNKWMPTSDLSSGNEYVPAITTGESGTVLASNWGAGLYRSSDNGDSWTNVGLNNGFIYDLSTAPDGNFFAFVSTINDHSIFRSTDDGLTWNEVFNRAHSDNFANGGGIVYSGNTFVALMSFTLGPTLGNIGVDVVRSTDSGETWEFVTLLTNIGHANDLTLLQDGRIVAATGLNGLMYSTNNGNTWQGLTTFPAVYISRIASNSNGDIFLGRNTAGSDDELFFRSTDNGNSWEGLGVITNFDGGNFNSIFIDEDDVIYFSIIYYGPTEYVAYRSLDNGETPEEFTDGIPASEIVYDISGGNNFIFAGTGEDGVYKREVLSIPVELTTFSASVIDNKVKLKWETSTETNNKGFEILKSETSDVKGQMNWNLIGFINGFGTTTEKQNYSFVDENFESGNYSYRLKQIDYDGSYEFTDIVEVSFIKPSVFSLEQNYPNPFNPSTIISFQLPEESKVVLKIYNILGSKVATLVNEIKPAGNYNVIFNASYLSTGVYVYRLKAGDFTKTMKMNLIK